MRRVSLALATVIVICLAVPALAQTARATGTVKDTSGKTMKGATASASYKPAKLETGVTVQVPPFIQIGDKVRVDPTDGSYLERVK